MSEFDKEAEREKLREKFARDEEKRKSTQRMSELLLKGATMTNRHCDTCGDPIFRYQGQEFCPTCQNARVAESGGAAGSAESAQSEATADGTQPEREPGDDADESDEVEVTPEPPQSGEPSTTRRASADESEAASPTQQSLSPSAASVDARTTTTEPASQSTSEDLSDARAALVRTVTRYATAAESAEDPRRAKELLSAAREAAETLSALNR
ncbi:Sjogren's syndrome/scleroderma autoantigen 1 family protein [Haloprofundus halophilus]|uniref:Sjogren's syndrome/scleroderma autoantigen 1 family protein n=1 Tax=Haloprofundus halophilus TaxID=2283527 RepID=UPI000E431D1E|nr:Sjogren's syndrome/scleroderma autoantigen 1 family protein [Haloprofundus halophilus]